MMLPEQVRAARALLGWSQAALAARAGISTTALNNIENEKADPKLSTMIALRRVVEAAGVEVRADGSVRLSAGSAAGACLRHGLAMTQPDDAEASPTVLLPLAEAASRLGLHPSALRSRIRRGLVIAKKGNDGRLLVEVVANARPDHGDATTSTEDELHAEIDFMRGQLEAARIA